MSHRCTGAGCHRRQSVPVWCTCCGRWRGGGHSNRERNPADAPAASRSGRRRSGDLAPLMVRGDDYYAIRRGLKARGLI